MKTDSPASSRTLLPAYSAFEYAAVPCLSGAEFSADSALLLWDSLEESLPPLFNFVL